MMNQQENLTTGDPLLLQIYNDGFFPQEQFKESTETLRELDRLEKVEQKLVQSLEEEEQKLFQEILLERTKFTSLLLKDAFFCYFRMEAQLMGDILNH
ncbi:DUF6809 family protein [Robinsoniella peoriensis]